MNSDKLLKPLGNSDESGFTIVESLVAIIIISILLVAIAPVLTLSVANRVQSKRVEAATKAAQGYMDGIRGGTVAHPSEQLASAMRTGTNTLAGYAAPLGTNLTCVAGKYCTAPQANLFCIDGDGDNKCTNTSNQDVIIQGFGYITTDNVSKGYRSYQLGTRVYRADAFVPGVTLQKGVSQSTVGSIKKAPPLYEATTEVVVEDAAKFKALCSDAGISTGC